MVRVRVGVPYVAEGVIFGSEVNRREVRVLSGGAKSFSNAVIKRLAVGNMNQATTLRVGQMS